MALGSRPSMASLARAFRLLELIAGGVVQELWRQLDPDECRGNDHAVVAVPSFVLSRNNLSASSATCWARSGFLHRTIMAISGSASRKMSIFALSRPES